jgi:hypothetical protein
MTKIQNIEDQVCCDRDHIFKTNEALLVPFNSSDIDLGQIVFVDNDFVVRTNISKNMVKGGFLLACPQCKLIHLAGFNVPNAYGTQVSGELIVVPERNLDTEL